MKINVLFFGQLTDITGVDQLTMDYVNGSDELIIQLHHQFPGLKNINYAVAIDKKIASENTELKENSTVALLPPFSGG